MMSVTGKMGYRLAVIFFMFFILKGVLFAQPLSKTHSFTHADTLRGSIGPGRDWWDVLKYDLHIKFNITDQTISGYNTIQYRVLKKGEQMQIDLQEPMQIDSCPGAVFTRDGNAFFLNRLPEQKPQTVNTITIYFHGRPVVAKKPPWDGGLVWAKDAAKNPWVSIACQGLGASVWFPCKDHQYDKADSAEMHITCPDTLTAVGNGRFKGKTDNKDGTATYDWLVTSPVSNYCLIPYIGKYAHFQDVYKGEKGDLDLDYWVLPENLEKAKTQFKDVGRMLKAFEYWFGPYPFYEDGYKLVDAPYLGMEHQSDIAYGNGYKNGYRGKDLSGSGWGLKWDFIIVHESGHEWFGNNITARDIADMWIHEGFTNYSETLFTEYYYGKDAGDAYCYGTRALIRNDIPVTGTYGVNQEGSGDMYDKAGNMLQTIRQIINEDETFRTILRGLNKTFYHQTVTAKQVEEFISREAKIDFSKVFEQYLHTVMVPVLEYQIKNSTLSYRWTNCVKDFNMPLKVSIKKNKYIAIYPTETMQTLKVHGMGAKNLKAKGDYYITTRHSIN